MKIQTLASLALVMSLLSAGAASAQAPPRIACAPDVQRMCPGAPPGPGQLMRCFKRRWRYVSPDCRSALAAAKALRAERRANEPAVAPGQSMQPPPSAAPSPQ